IRSKLIAHVEVETTAAVISIALQRISIIEAQRADRQIKAKPDTDIRGDMVKAERPLVAVHKAGVVKDRPAAFLKDRKNPFDGPAPHRLSTDRFASVILRTNFAIRKSAQII